MKGNLPEGSLLFYFFVRKISICPVSYTHLIEPRYRYPYFSHIFDGGYSAGYYFYTWAEVLDKDEFAAFRESGDLFNTKIAADFRTKLLARGGSEDGDVYKRQALRHYRPAHRGAALPS